MGGWHARYALRAGAHVAAVVDQQPDRAELLARHCPGARVFATIEESLQAGGLDVVHICTPRESHESLAAVALSAGSHVLVEKPAALSGEGARRLAEAARASKRVLCPVHQFPFQRGFVWLLARRDRLGRYVRVSHDVHSAGGEGLGNQPRRRLLTDITAHGLSLCRALFGSAVDELAWRVQRATGSDLDLIATCGDAELSLCYSLEARPTRNEVLITGTQGTARVNLFHGFATFETGRPSRRSKILQPFKASAVVWMQAGANLAHRAWTREPAYPGLLALIRAFYSSISEAGPPPISPEELVASAALVERLSG